MSKKDRLKTKMEAMEDVWRHLFVVATTDVTGNKIVEGPIRVAAAYLGKGEEGARMVLSNMVVHGMIEKVGMTLRKIRVLPVLSQKEIYRFFYFIRGHPHSQRNGSRIGEKEVHTLAFTLGVEFSPRIDVEVDGVRYVVVREDQLEQFKQEEAQRAQEEAHKHEGGS